MKKFNQYFVVLLYQPSRAIITSRTWEGCVVTPTHTNTLKAYVCLTLTLFFLFFKVPLDLETFKF